MTTNERIFLIGLRGSGKTTAGRLLAKHIGWRFADADDVLENAAGRSIAEIFAAEGEAGFRDREADNLRNLVKVERHVIACGGGVVLRAENRSLLRDNGICIWLTGDPVTLQGRIEHDPTTIARRPALTELSPEAEVERLLREREPLYREVAHLTVATDGLSPHEVVSAILSAWPTFFTNCR